MSIRHLIIRLRVFFTILVVSGILGRLGRALLPTRKRL